MTEPPDPVEPGLIDVVALLPGCADAVVVGAVRGTHRALARWAFGLLDGLSGRTARPVQRLHDDISSGVYSATGSVLRAAGQGLATLGERGVGPRLDDGPTGRALHSAVNGVVGARLRDEAPRLDLGATVRVRGRAVAVTADGLAEGYPDARGRLVVLLHGHGEHEGHWDVDRHRIGGTYDDTVREAGWTPVRLRVNTGLGVGGCAVSVAALVQRLVDAWPVEVERIALVGHAGGGLVLQAACAVVTERPRCWTERVGDVITLGTPHPLADLTGAVLSGKGLLAMAPAAAAWGRTPASVLPEVPALPHARYRLVSPSPGTGWHLLGGVLRDVPDRTGSATADDRRFLRSFPDADLLHVRRVDHLGLLNHPDVHEALRRWLV